MTRDAREVLCNPQWKRLALEWVRRLKGPKLGCQALLVGGGGSSSILLLYCHYLYFLLPYGFPPKIQKSFFYHLKLKMRNYNNSTISVNMTQWSICNSWSPIHDLTTRHIPRMQMSVGKIFGGHFITHPCTVKISLC